MKPIRTARLELVPATVRLLEADREGAARLAGALGVAVPDAWPPELYDRSAIEYTLGLLGRAEGRAGWGLWYIVRRPAPGEAAQLVGVIGFSGGPDEAGRVEVGYAVLEEFRRRGFASEALGAVVDRAFERPEVAAVRAETYPELRPSIRVLEKTGFAFVGPGAGEGTLRFERTRAAHEAGNREPGFGNR